MKKSLLAIALIIGALVVFTNVAIAQTEELSTRPSKRVDVLEQRAEQRTQQRAQVKEDIAQKRQEVRAKVAQVHSERLTHRFTVYFERLGNIIDRLQERLNLLAGQGKDVAAAQAKLNEAKASLAQAKTKADAAVSAFSGIDDDNYEQQRSLALQARDIANEARNDFQTVLKSIREVLTLIKMIG